MDWTKELEELKQIDNPLLRRARFMAILSRELDKRGKNPVYIVGGHAVELYTQGGYTTMDIDIKGPRDAIVEILGEMGFTRRTREYEHPELDLYIDWLGEGLQAPEEDRERARTMEIDEEKKLYVKLIGYEDLIIDRLCSQKYFGDQDGGLWARQILLTLIAAGEKPDMDYLDKRAKDEEVEDVWQQLKAVAQEE